MFSRRRKPSWPRPPWLIEIQDYMLLVLGCVIVGLAFNGFVFPNRIASGGVSGISTIIGHLADFAPGYIQWAINIPLFFVGVWVLGRRFGMKTLVGTMLFPFVVVLSAQMEPVTLDPLLAAIFGGIGIGIGLGLIFRGRGSTGGTSLVAQIIHKYTGLTIGTSLLLIDGFIVASAAFAFSLELALYALLAVYITSKTIDVVQLGLGYGKMALIISDHQKKIEHALLYELDRGVTGLSAKGGYTGEAREVLMCVVQQTEVTRLKTLIRQIDPSAFVVVSDANEVLGEGFRRFRADL